ncbi:MAG: YhdH/YhfP family quinone oxidoreductase [Thermodesulfobacteriota bacterium]|nr:YhdH/YhfP family quinone oxidoreductase [Thermodesulfobacteriota bacterium]
MAQTFSAFQVTQDEPKTFSRAIVERTLDELPEGELVVQVAYSSLNFKDALSATGNPGVTRKFPHTPGIDAAGVVISCSDGSFATGDEVIVTSYDLGMGTAGGFGQMIRIPSRWALPLPAGLTPRTSMMYGTAGLTAALSVQELVNSGITPDDGSILVTGATGGVGSLAVAILAKAGYSVTAATGKMDEADHLRQLGATEVIERDQVTANNDRPMLKPVWAGVIDCVGGDTLAAAIKATKYGGAVTCCGLVASPALELNVFPFILRGVRLIGIDSAECPMAKRIETWNKLATCWNVNQLEKMVDEVDLGGLEQAISAMLKGKLKRRVLVKLPG